MRLGEQSQVFKMYLLLAMLVCVAALRLSPAAVGGCSLRWLLPPQGAGSGRSGFSSGRISGPVAVACWLEGAQAPAGAHELQLQALRRGLGSCGAAVYLLGGMWGLTGPGIKDVSPALTGRLLSTAPPGKSQEMYFPKQI